MATHSGHARTRPYLCFFHVNLGLIRRTALNLLQQDTSNKWSVRRRKMRANFDLSYREAVLFRKGAENNS